MTDQDIVSALEVRKLSYSSNPWRLVHRETGQQLSGGRSLVNGEGKTVHYNGSYCFPLKRDAVAFLRELSAEVAL